VLGRILSETRERISSLHDRAAALHRRAHAAASPPPFASALGGDRIAVVAEIKRRSPSKGDINPSLTPALQARALTLGGAAAISVLTEPHNFGGHLDDLAEARRGSDLPLLRKDFIIDPLQIAEARAAGASAVLLIARALAPDQLADLAAATQSYGLESLVEVRSEDELDRALALPVSVIGVNSRDLETLEVERAVSARLIPLIPSDRLAVAESGVSTVEEAAELARMGADAVLVGSALSASADPSALVRALAAVPRVGRARRD
jgi:indole-3-glycerol phosphate synthase